MAEPSEALKVALADRYAVDRELGRGGMATVYLARDVRHDRDVAVKVLRADLAEAVGADRFLREITITARLNHPHILPLLDSGNADGILYYVIPYVAGGSLRHRLRREGRLPLPVATRIAESVASALDHAHRQGVIHRDIKPENILFSEGLPVVADFGIAKAVSTAGGDQLTRSGFPLGTPGYMSPEQASGQTTLDPRTDVCALGCVCYEMLVGETPSIWTTPDETRLGRFADLPPGHREQLDQLPGRVEQALVRALAIRPPERFATPLLFAEALAGASQGSGRLSDEESRAIIERAAELDAELVTEDGALSIGGVERVAAAAGIPPARVREAAEGLRQLGTPGLPPREPTGASKKKNDLTIIEWEIDGEISASAHALLVEEIQSTLGVAGHATQLGSSLTWSPAAEGEGGRRLVVTVRAKDGRTRIRIEEKYTLTEWRLFMPGLGAALGILSVAGLLTGLVGLPEGPGIVVPILLGGFGGGVSAANIILRAMSSGRRALLERVADRLCETVAQSVAAPNGLEGGVAPPQLPRWR